MSATWMAILRALHVLSSSFWVGVMLLNAGFLLPAVRASGPAGGEVMKHMVQGRRLPLWLNAAVLVTLLSGFWLLWWASAGFAATWLRSRRGLALLTASTATVAAALLGLLVNAPTARRLGQTAARIQASGAPPSADDRSAIQGMQARLFRATVAAAALLSLAAILMAASRYLP